MTRSPGAMEASACFIQKVLANNDKSAILNNTTQFRQILKNYKKVLEFILTVLKCELYCCNSIRREGRQ